ncbi:MAG: hypothetical protein TREMPRED_006036, partial [Tremellales sp. Tagirdzhanova-0007]
MTYADWQEFADPATEFILSLADLRPAQVVSWQDGRIGRDIVDLLIGRLVMGLEDQKDDCSEWLEETKPNEEDDPCPIFCEESLNRLATSIGGKKILPHLSEIVQALLKAPEWRCRYSALIAIGSVADAFLDDLKPVLPTVVSIILPAARDQHPRVRH